MYIFNLCLKVGVLKSFVKYSFFRFRYTKFICGFEVDFVVWYFLNVFYGITFFCGVIRVLNFFFFFGYYKLEFFLGNI